MNQVHTLRFRLRITLSHVRTDSSAQTLTLKSESHIMNALIVSDVEIIDDSKVEILDDATLNSEVIKTLRESLNKNVNSRIDYETSKNANECASKIARYFSFDFKTRVCKISDEALAAAARANVTSFDFMNSHTRENQRFNIYAIKRLASSIYALTKSRKLDANVEYLLKNLEHFRDEIESNKITYTREHAYHIASSIYSKSDSTVKRSHIKYRMSDRSVNTATAQMSATMRVLEALRVFRVIDSKICNVNYDHALFAHVRAK